MKFCIKSIEKKNNKLRHIIIISKDNYYQYCKIPSKIIDKFNRGNISITHFSDLLRLDLLYTYGGIWIDSTMWLVDNMPSNIDKLPLFTIKHGQFSDWHVCRGLWSSFFLACGKGDSFIGFARELLFSYWYRFDTIICYLLTDVLFCVAYDTFDWARKEIDDIPWNNSDVFKLQDNCSRKYNEPLFNNWCKQTFAFKLSYKRPFPEKINGEITFWGEIIRRTKNIN